jgi:hypothetical protein
MFQTLPRELANAELSHRVQASPAWSSSLWSRCTEQELLIDLEEWARAAGREPLTHFRCAVTPRLWTLLETVPFEEARHQRLDARLCHLARSAQRVLERLPGEPCAPGVVADFAFPLRGRSDDPPACLLRLHVERSDEGPLFVTLGRREDFTTHPLGQAPGLADVLRTR